MPARASRGFTLVELLVAAAITLVLAGVLVAVSARTLDFWRRANESWTTAVAAGVVLDMLERDLQGALFRPNGSTWMAVDMTDSAAGLVSHGWLTTGVMKPAGAESRAYIPESGLADARFGLSGAWLRFITSNLEAAASTGARGSLPIAVSYQLVRRPSSGAIDAANPARVRYSLYRAAVSNETTFAIGHDVLAAGYASSAAAPPAARSARTLTNPNSADVIATNVVDFGVWLYRRDAAGELVRIFPASASDGSHAAADAAQFPSVADVMVRVLTEEGADRLEQLEKSRGTVTRPAGIGSDVEWWWAVVLEHSRAYVRRMEIRSDAR